MDLCNLAAIKRLFDKYGLSPKKGYGQNFLINPAIPRMIAESAYKLVESSDRAAAVLEIGPGVGALTCRLAEHFEKVVSVEIDTGLIPLLNDVLVNKYDNVEIVCGDIMKIDLPRFIEEKFGEHITNGGTLSVCANLPYYITSPVIMKLLESFAPSQRLPFSGITVMIQLEVADRLCADPGTAQYGAITASVALRADVNKLFSVKAGNFYPVPKVSSSVAAIIPHSGIREVYPEFSGTDKETDEFAQRVKHLISLAFGKRRKTFVNAVSEVYPRDAVSNALISLGIRSDIRGEKLSAYDFCRIANILSIAVK